MVGRPVVALLAASGTVISGMAVILRKSLPHAAGFERLSNCFARTDERDGPVVDRARQPNPEGTWRVSLMVIELSPSPMMGFAVQIELAGRALTQGSAIGSSPCPLAPDMLTSRITSSI
jgi:hypothetical protein